MRLSPRLLLAVALALGALAVPAVAIAKEPPNGNDPCSSGGRNTCDTTGVGFYTTYEYGLRWFGDYRGVVADAAHTFCIDLQYWYPSPKYRFREVTTGELKNREGESVSLENQRRMAYAIWAYGRSGTADQQAAVMLYVHALMGDARPGEVDPAGVRDSVAAIYDDVARDSAHYHGPYRVELEAPARLRVGEQGTATIRVLSASGVAVPDVELTLTAKGAGVPSKVSTGADGVASVTFTARSADGASFEVRTEPIASTLPAIYAPTTQAAAVNGQRLAAPRSQVVTGADSTTAFKAQVRASSVADPSELVVGETSRDRVTLSGASDSYDAVVTARLYGPFRSTGAIRCDGEPAWEGQWQAHGSGEYTTRAVTLRKPGWYVYRHVIPGDAGHTGTKTTCTEPLERVKVIALPTLRTQVSRQQATPGAELTDLVIVEGLAGERATIQAMLYGPFAHASKINCAGTPVWKGTVDAKGDGEYRTEPFKLAEPGYYTYVERLGANDFVLPAATGCGEETETTVVAGTPQVRTQISDQQVRPGAELTDKLVVSGIGGLDIAIKVELFGPFQTRGGISCDGTAVWSDTYVAHGNGTYTTDSFTVERVGYYTYRESIPDAPQNSPFTGKCGVQAETSMVTAVPRVTTLVSDDVVAPGSVIHDEITVSGLGESQARIGVELFGPFASVDAIGCTGKPYATGEVFAQGDGTVRSQGVKLEKAGFYTYREKLVGTDFITETETECGLVAETALARPLVLTGRNEALRSRRVAAADPLTPARVRVESLGIDAPVFGASIDLKAGALAVPSQTQRLGWWVDGQTPGAKSGAVLIAGHIDRKTAGAGAFFRLHEAARDTRIQVTTKNGRTFTYRVTSVQTMPKEQLPPGIYSRNGGPRLVLVTCGGPFDASRGHYRDNVVVTAVPV